MTVLNDLRQGRARIVQGWCKNTWATDSTGWSLEPDDPEAVHWCARGAVGSYTDRYNRAAELALYRALPEIPVLSDVYKGTCAPGDVVAWFNNSRVSSEEVLALFDRAIAAEEQRLIRRPTQELVAELMKRVEAAGEVAECV